MVTDPIFFVGAPRSGTTVTFEHFASHPDLAWISNYVRRYPTFEALNLIRRLTHNSVIPLRGKKNQFGDAAWWNRFLPWPDESYGFWEGYGPANFGRSCLNERVATTNEKTALQSALDRIRKYQGKARVTTKMTGPGRIGYLQSVWPDMYVVHVIRDGLDVTRSLLNTNFWKNNGGYEKPWWDGAYTAEELERWEDEGKDPASLAALQWRNLVSSAREEGSSLLGNRYIELRYEDFVENSVAEIERLYEAVGLNLKNSELEPLEQRNKSYKSAWSQAERLSLAAWMQPEYGELGYRV